MHKFSNLGVQAYNSVLKESPEICLDPEMKALSKEALVAKGIQNYISSIDGDLIDTRIKYGFLNKKAGSAGQIKFFQQRWFFMVSSRPLDSQNYLRDPRTMDETLIPPLLELDTIYYYIMGKAGDSSGQCGEIKTIDILNVTIKDMSKSKGESGHALIIDTGTNRIHLNTPHKFDLETWLEAILCSMQTAKETRLSLTEQCRNISQTIMAFDTNKQAAMTSLQHKMGDLLPITSKYEDVDQLLEACSQVNEDILSTINACMSQQPQRRDIITVYMDISHRQICSVLSHYWEKQAVKLSAFDTLTLIDWCYQYIRNLKDFGITDSFLKNGFNNLCNAYSRKMHSQIYPAVVTILQNEFDMDNAAEGGDLQQCNAPQDLVGILKESFTIVIAKKIPELTLKVLTVYTNIIT